MLDKSIVTQNIQVFDLNERLGDSISNVPNIAVTHFLLELHTKIRETAQHNLACVMFI